MKTRVLGFLLILLAASTVAGAQPTPLDQPLPAGEISMIASFSVYGMQRAPNWPRDGLFHYRLYLPDDYYQHQRNYPVMFIAAPKGNAQMGVLEERLKRDRWIVVMLVESRNRSILWNPNFVAAYDDIMQRLRVQPEMLFCTGLSGAARVCGAYPSVRPGMQGLILQGAGFLQRPAYLIGVNAGITVYGIFGRKDPNLLEVINIRGALPEHTRNIFEIWDGGHTWAPQDVMQRALEWSEDKALLDAPYKTELTDIYYWYFANKLRQYQQESRGIERYRLGKLLQSLSERWQLQFDESVLAELQTIDDIEPAELEAYEAFVKIHAEESTARGDALKALVDVYAGISTKYPDTRYGQLAALRQQSLLWEVRKN